MPEIIAHRGASRECLENTMSAFDRALEQGADGIELDVHATRDGVVVVHHDYSVHGQWIGTPSAETTIAELEAATLERLRLGNMEGVPTLDAVLDRVGTRGVVYVEVKGIAIERQVAACLDRHQTVRTAVHAFDHRIPLAIRRLRPGTRTGILSASYVLDLASMVEPAEAEDLWQHAQLIDQELVHQAHAMGARVVAWTENSPNRAHALVNMGVDAICTDVPGALRRALEGDG